MTRTGADAGHDYRWVMFAGMTSVYFGFGIMVSSIPPMVTEVREDLGMSRGQMGLALGAWTFMYIFIAPLAGRAVDRLGVKRALALGGLSTVGTALARSAAQGTGTLWLAVAVLGIGGPLISSAAPTLCSRWFADESERRFAVSIYNLGPGIGGILTLFLTNSVLLPWLGSWRRVMLFEAAIAMALTIGWVIIAARAPTMERADVKHARTPMLAEWRGLLASADVRHALILGTMTFFVMHSLNNWLVDALSEQADLSAGAASNWIASAGILGMALLFVAPRAAGRFGRQKVLTAAWAIIMTGLLLVGFGTPVMVVIGAFGTGARAVLIPMMILAVMTARGVNDANMGAANGLWFSAAQIGAVAGPFSVGLIGDSGAGFRGAMVLLAAVGLATIAMVQLRNPEAETPTAVAARRA